MMRVSESQISMIQRKMKMSVNSRNAKLMAKRKIKRVREETSSSSDNSSSEDSDYVSKEVENRICKNKVKRRRVIEISSSDSSSSKDEKAAEDVFFVEKILNMKVEDGKRYFFVKWLNFPDEENSWEPEENMQGSTKLIKKFLDSRREESLQNRVILKRCQDHISSKKEKLENKHSSKSSNVKSCTQKQDNPKQPLSEVQVNIPPPNIEQVPSNQKLNPLLVFVIRVWLNEQIHLLYLDITEKKDEYYNVILTEDIKGKDPLYIYGAAEGVDGNKYCMVQFKGNNYIDIVPSSNLIERYPCLVEFFTLQKRLSISLSRK